MVGLSRTIDAKRIFENLRQFRSRKHTRTIGPGTRNLRSRCDKRHNSKTMREMRIAARPAPIVE
jgi:hypothetical protein